MEKKLVAFFIFLVAGSLAFSQPNEINFQGILKDSNGNKVNGTFSMSFNFYDSKDATTPVYAFTPAEKVEVSNGVFHVLIDLSMSKIFKQYSSLWVGVKVENEPEFPKIKIVSVGYAIHSKFADSLLNPADDVACTGCVGTDDIANNSITGVKIQDASIDNSKIQSVSWSKITDIPQDIADGDNDTTYEAGTGITISQDNTISLDSTYVTGEIYDSRFVNENQSSSISSDMIIDGTITFADLGSNSCGGGKVMKFDGTSWTCGNDELGIDGTGTPGYVPLFNEIKKITISDIYQDSNKFVGIGTKTPAVKLEVNGEIKIGNSNTDCNASTEGAIRYNSTSKVIEYCNGNFWVKVETERTGQTKDQAAVSCKKILLDGYSVGNGIYWIDPDGGDTSNAFQVYCDMEYAGGGWTLVLKVKSGDVDTFGYISDYWSNDEVLNPDSFDPNEDVNMKNKAYSTLSFTEVRLCLNTLDNCLVEAKVKPSAKELFAGTSTGTKYSRNDFLNWIPEDPSNWNNQPYCNKAGYNIFDGYHAKCRFGIIMNNENDCVTSDSAVGFGCYTNDHYDASHGDRRFAAGAHRWNPTTIYPKKGWIFVR